MSNIANKLRIPIRGYELALPSAPWVGVSSLRIPIRGYETMEQQVKRLDKLVTNPYKGL